MATNAPDRYTHPLSARYVSREMERIFAPAFRFGTWRRLWLALAEAQRDLGLDIPAEAIAQMRDHLDDIDLDAAARYERRFRHDVMAHIHLFGDVAPTARGILHLGATSAFVGDNTDLIQHREAMTLVRDRVVATVRALARFAGAPGRADAAYTHFQPPSPDRGNGPRLDPGFLSLRRSSTDWHAEVRGWRGTTGAGVVPQLFHGIREVEHWAGGLPFAASRVLRGPVQTYSRKVDRRSGHASRVPPRPNDATHPPSCICAHSRNLREGP